MNDEPSAFRTLAISDPKWEVDHLRQVTVSSRSLRGRGDVTLFVPPQVETLDNVPLVILLHGVYGSHWNWTQKGGVHRTAGRMIKDGRLPPLVIAMPSDGLRGDGTAYVPHKNQDFESWIVDDVPQVALEVVAAVTTRSPRFIAGLSMGGFGAMRLGAKYGRRFKGIGAHSSVTATDQFAGIVEEALADLPLAPDEHRLIDVMGKYRESLPPLRFDCGTEDVLLDHNRALHQQLLAVGIPHQYEEHPGDHEWAYWETHVERTLAFFAGILQA